MKEKNWINNYPEEKIEKPEKKKQESKEEKEIKEEPKVIKEYIPIHKFLEKPTLIKNDSFVIESVPLI